MLLGLAGGFLKSLGGKKKKKKTSGEEMANNITNKSKDKNLSITVREKQSIVKGADITPLKDIRDDMKQSSSKNKDPLNLALDGIDNSLFGIIDTLTETNVIRKKLKSEENKEEQLEKKNLRERMLEGASGLLKGSVKMVKRIGGKTLDNLMNFLTWTILGAVVNYIIKNWKSVREQIEKMMEELREIWINLEPILVGVKDIVMWFGNIGWGWITKINKRVDDLDTASKIKEIEKTLDNTDALEKNFKGTSEELDNFQKEIEAAGNDKEKMQEIIAKYEPLFKIEQRQSNFLNPITQAGKEGALNKEGSEPERLIDTFSSSSDTITVNNEETGMTEDEYRLATYYVDENGYVRLKEDDSRPIGSRFIDKDGLERRDNSQSTIKKNDIQSYFVGIDDYSDDFDESSIILFSEGEGGSMNNGSKTPMFFGGSSDGLNIEDLYKIKINQ
tara:strand:- start:1964 stop:3301 length:1338 start_codon:yes stop_codon:yes gene_type:complete